MNTDTRLPPKQIAELKRDLVQHVQEAREVLRAIKNVHVRDFVKGHEFDQWAYLTGPSNEERKALAIDHKAEEIEAILVQIGNIVVDNESSR